MTHYEYVVQQIEEFIKGLYNTPLKPYVISAGEVNIIDINDLSPVGLPDSLGYFEQDGVYGYFMRDPDRGYVDFIKKYDDPQSLYKAVTETILVRAQARYDTDHFEETPYGKKLNDLANILKMFYGYKRQNVYYMISDLRRNDALLDESYEFLTDMITKSDVELGEGTKIRGYTAKSLYEKYKIEPQETFVFLSLLEQYPEESFEEVKKRVEEDTESETFNSVAQRFKRIFLKNAMYPVKSLEEVFVSVYAHPDILKEGYIALTKFLPLTLKIRGLGLDDLKEKYNLSYHQGIECLVQLKEHPQKPVEDCVEDTKKIMPERTDEELEAIVEVINMYKIIYGEQAKHINLRYPIPRLCEERYIDIFLKHPAILKEFNQLAESGLGMVIEEKDKNIIKYQVQGVTAYDLAQQQRWQSLAIYLYLMKLEDDPNTTADDILKLESEMCDDDHFMYYNNPVSES